MIGERTKLAQPRRLVFLPGAGGDPSFWQPVADLLRERAKPVLLGWPGHAGLPLDSSIAGIGDLAELVLREMTSPCALVAQSMGGVVAMIAALRRPALVSHLVLVAIEPPELYALAQAGMPHYVVDAPLFDKLRKGDRWDS